MKKLYCFDFDGTLTHKDTMFEFLKFVGGAKYAWLFLKYMPLFILVKLKLVDAEKVKKSFIGAFLKGKNRSFLKEKAQLFFEQNHQNLIRQEARNFLSQIDFKENDGLLVTASLDIWVQPFADELGLKLISTRAEFQDEKYTGEFVGKNCNGEEKVRRIRAFLGDKTYDKTIAFGDTRGDKPMLRWANVAYYRHFK